MPTNLSTWQAFFFCLLLFLVFFLLNKPFIAAFEDLHIEYLLSGGYGESPDLQLHYYYGWHPFVFAPIYFLYGWLPETNWYGLFLIAVQFFAHLLLIQQLITRVGFKTAYPIYLIFFFLFGFPFLQKLEIATTSSLLALAACSKIIFLYSKQRDQKNYNSRRNEIFFILCLVFASLLRFHTAFLVLAMFALAALVLMNRKGLQQFLLAGLISIIISLVLFQIQKLIYQEDPAYASWKTKSDLYFSMTNRPNTGFTPTDSIQKMEASFILQHYWVDSSMITEQKINPFIRTKLLSPNSSSSSSGKEALFWSLQNNRLILLMILMLMVVSFLVGGRAAFLKSLALAAIGLSIFLGLLIFFKTREHLILTISSFIFLCITGVLVSDLSKKGKVFGYLLFGVFTILGCWRIIQQMKTEKNLNNQVVNTKGFIESCSRFPEKLFINPSNEGWMALRAFDSPRQFPLKNVLTRELLMTGKFIPIFERFQILSLTNQLVNNPRIVLLGANQPYWVHYYLWKHGLRIEVQPGPSLQQIPSFELKTH